MSGVPGYLIEREVGRGSTAIVFLARRIDSVGAPVVLKRIRPGVPVDRLRHEATVLSAIDHPHVLAVLDVVPDGDGVALVMPYASGGSLASVLAKRGRLDAPNAVAVLVPVAEGLAAAHASGILHLDVKAANVLFGAGGRPLLADFGHAWHGAPAVPGLRCVGTAEGTVRHLDPAVAAGNPADARSDVFALGVLAYACLAGRLPDLSYQPASAGSSAISGCVGDRLARLAPDAPPALVETVGRAMSADPGDRFASAAEFASALRGSVAGTSVAGTSVAGDLTRCLPPAQAARVDRAAHPLPRPAGWSDLPTLDIGPRPPPAPPAAPVVPRGRWRTFLGSGGPRSRKVRGALLGLLLLAVVAAAGRVLLSRIGHPRPDPTGHVSACAPPAPSVALPQGALLGDVDGDGCIGEVVTFDGSVLVAPVGAGGADVSFEFGRPADVLLLGDWTCQGRDTPALYRPGTGEVFVFLAWDGGPVRVDHVAPSQTVRTVAKSGSSCARVEVKRVRSESRTGKP